MALRTEATQGGSVEGDDSFEATGGHISSISALERLDELSPQLVELAKYTMALPRTEPWAKERLADLLRRHDIA
jgi:hypothetical protein